MIRPDECGIRAWIDCYRGELAYRLVMLAIKVLPRRSVERRQLAFVFDKYLAHMMEIWMGKHAA